MSIAMVARTVTYSILAVWLLSETASAEMAEGTVQNPITGEYSERVYRDWNEGIVLDPRTGNHIVTYKHGSENYYFSVVYEPSTKIQPELKSRFSVSKGGNSVVFEYRLKSDKNSRQDIHSVSTIVTSIRANGLLSPKDWDGTAVPTLTNQDLILSWTHAKEGDYGGLEPGRALGGFVIESGDLPGIAIAEVRGNGRRAVWLGHVPAPSTAVGKQAQEIMTNDYVSRLIAAPRIPMSMPFNAAAILSSIQVHFNTELARLDLIDPTLRAELDRWLNASIAAAGAGNDKALRANLHEARRLLRREHAELEKDEDWDEVSHRDKNPKCRIDRLAARVLDFDLRYVAKRVKGLEN